MGSATIVRNDGDGLYVIELVKGTQTLQTNKTGLQDLIAEIEEDLVDLRYEHFVLVGVLSDAHDTLRDAVAVFASADPPTPALRKAVTDATAAYITAEANVNKKQNEINLKVQELTSLQKRLEKVDEALEADRYEAWCADYSVDLEGTVGTLEVNGETDEIIIMPGGKTGAGKVYDSAAMSPSGWFYNLALLPCWQKYKPTYRIGTIVSVDQANDTCSVALKRDRSRVQGLEINQGGTSYSISKAAHAGWDDFARRNPAHPLVTNTDSTEIAYTDDLRKDLDSVQALVNDRYTYRLDQQVYNKLEYWSSMGDGGSGDCEDFAITKAEKLIAMGYPASAIHIEIGLAKDTFWNVGGQPEQVGHAWLVVQTDNGDYCLDILHKEVIRNELTGYTDRQRQTGTSWNEPGLLYNNVPIDYMDFDSVLFEEGDEVVVEFSDQTWPSMKVIGFRDNPRYFGRYDIGFYNGQINWYELHRISFLNDKFQYVSPTYETESLAGTDFFVPCFGIAWMPKVEYLAFLGMVDSSLYEEEGIWDYSILWLDSGGNHVHTQPLLQGITFWTQDDWSIAVVGEDEDIGCIYLSVLAADLSSGPSYLVKYDGVSIYEWTELSVQTIFPSSQYNPIWFTKPEFIRLKDGTQIWWTQPGRNVAQGTGLSITAIKVVAPDGAIATHTLSYPYWQDPYGAGYTMEGDIITFMREVGDKLIYGCWHYYSYAYWTGSNESGWVYHEGVTSHVELRLCSSKTSPLSYTVLATGSTGSLGTSYGTLTYSEIFVDGDYFEAHENGEVVPYYVAVSATEQSATAGQPPDYGGRPYFPSTMYVFRNSSLVKTIVVENPVKVRDYGRYLRLCRMGRGN